MAREIQRRYSHEQSKKGKASWLGWVQEEVSGSDPLRVPLYIYIYSMNFMIHMFIIVVAPFTPKWWVLLMEKTPGPLSGKFHRPDNYYFFSMVEGTGSSTILSYVGTEG